MQVAEYQERLLEAAAIAAEGTEPAAATRLAPPENPLAGPSRARPGQSAPGILIATCASDRRVRPGSEPGGAGDNTPYRGEWRGSQRSASA